MLFLVARSRAGPTLSFRRGNERVTRLTKTRWRFSSRKPAAAEEAGVEAGGEGLLRPPLLRAPPAAGGKGGGGGWRARPARSSGWLPRCTPLPAEAARGAASGRGARACRSRQPGAAAVGRGARGGRWAAAVGWRPRWGSPVRGAGMACGGCQPSGRYFQRF